MRGRGVSYAAVQIPNEQGRLVWVVQIPNGDIARHGAVYRGDVGRIRIFRTERAAADWAHSANERAAGPTLVCNETIGSQTTRLSFAIKCF
jgi:hypothetical protein